MYMIAKHIHLTTIALSIAGFLLRLLWRVTASPWADKKLVKVLPHVNDSILLVSGIYLAWLLQQYPWAHAWLAAKVIALLLYIYLGAKALKSAENSRKLVYGVAAVLTFAYMVLVALNKSPLFF